MSESVKKTNKKFAPWQIAVIAGAVIVIIVSVIFIIRGFTKPKAPDDDGRSYEDIMGIIRPGADDGDYGDTVFPEGILPMYKKAYSVNNDLVGWIRVPGTAVDHPVVKAKDNDFYLRRDFFGNYEQRGTVFMDFHNRVQSLSKNTILYGHNYLDSTMFSDLEKYKDIEFYKQAPIIEFNTIYKEYKWKVVAVFLTTASKEQDNDYIFNYIYPNMGLTSYMGYIKELEKRRLYDTGVDLLPTDKILTLSTCTLDMDMPNLRANARCVVVARLLRNGESEEVDTSLAKVNPSPKYPQLWYDKFKKDNPYKNDAKWYPSSK